MFFNCPPQIDPREFDVHLPCPDNAWEATDPFTCAKNLGIFDGQRIRESSNKATFVGLMRHLMSSSTTLLQFPTTVLSKFLLIHGLHVQIWISHASTEHPQQGWMKYWLGPRQQNGHDHIFENRVLDFALDKWLQEWLQDLQIQYPDSKPNLGFMNDPVPYYYVGKDYVKHPTRRVLGFAGAGAEGNVKIMMRTLDKARARAAQDQPYAENIESRADEYGIEDLAYDMKLMFAPAEKLSVSDFGSP